MNFFDGLFGRKASKVTTDQAQNFAGEVKELGQYLAFLQQYFKVILEAEPEVDQEIDRLIEVTQQKVIRDILLKRMWAIRYALLHLWFFQLKSPQSQQEVKENFALIERAFTGVLDKHKGYQYLSPVMEEFVTFANIENLKVDNLETFESDLTEKIADEIPLIAFDCTEGRLAGELHDGVIKLIMMTVAKDKESFQMDEDRSLGVAAKDNINKVINDLSASRKKAAKEFFVELLGDSADSETDHTSEL